MIDYNYIAENNKTVCLLLSGGVDSAVSLYELVAHGIHPDCWYIKIGPEQEDGYNCNSDEDIEMCQWLTNHFGCTFNIIDCHNDYWTAVTTYTMDCVKKGLTPNPDVMCNKLIKFGVFHDKVGKNYDYIATGHYAQSKDGKLYCAPDPVKDQTDFLCQLDESIIKKTLFPIGHLMKDDVRKIAEDQNLINKKRKDSQGICFLGKINYNDYVEKFLGKKTGDFIEYESGNVMGQHNGYWFHTIGQRKGIGLGGGPWYVVGKDIDKNIVYISKNKNIVDSNLIYIDDMHWIGFNPFAIHEKVDDLAPVIECNCKIRHSPEMYNGLLYKFDNGYVFKLYNDKLTLAPGQYCVIYDQKTNWCLGSGIIQNLKK